MSAWEQTPGYMASKHMPLIPFFPVAAILLEVLGGLSVLTGFRARLGGGAFIIFLIPTTVVFHDFRTYTGQEQQVQLINFLKNLAILGGLFLVPGLGPGELSLDGRNAGARQRLSQGQ